MTADHESGDGEMALTQLGQIRLAGKLGERGRSVVREGFLDGKSVAVKLYKATAIVRHARKHPVSLARFEFTRNRDFFEAPGLRDYVAQPLGFIDQPGLGALVQERLEGELYYFRHQRTGSIDRALFAHVERIIALSHEAGLADVDLHAMNVMVVAGPQGEPWPKLFDFNLIPFHVRPPNPFVGLLLRLGLRSRTERDLRKLRNFHDFGRVERKLLRFYPKQSP